MSTINERLGKVVSASGLSKTAFAKRINVTQQYVSKMVVEGMPSDRTISDICREFGVSEVWLRTGQGQMLDDSADSILDRLAAEYHLDDRKRAILTAFLKLSSPDQDAVLRYVSGVAAELSAQKPDPLDIDAEVEAYRQELLAQKKAEESASASAGCTAAG